MKAHGQHGGCQCERVEQAEASVSLYIDFEDALKLSTAIQSAVLELNRYNRRPQQGIRRMGLLISVKAKNVMVLHGHLRRPREKAPKREAHKSSNSK